METCSRKQRWNNNSSYSNNNRRTQNRKPPHGSWHPKTVPSWEKDFCKIVGYFDWDTLLQMKKCLHFYDNVIRWNDSAGEEAFHNAKKRYWADINGFHCDVPLPDPDLYIQNIDWNTKIVPDPLDDLDSLPPSPKSGHDPVVIFGDLFLEDQGFSPTGWQDAEENFNVPINNNFGGTWGQNLNWGEYCDNNWLATGWTDCDYSNNNYYSCGQNLDWGDSCYNNVAANGWLNFTGNNAWKYSNGAGAGYTLWGGGWNDNNLGWGFAHNVHNNSLGPYDGDVRGDGRAYTNTRVQANGGHKNQMWRGNKGLRNKVSYNQGRQDERAGLREWDSNSPCWPVGQRASNRVGEAWNLEKGVS